MKGGKVTSAQMSTGKDDGGAGGIQVVHGTIQPSFSDGGIEDVKRYTTIERFHANGGGSGFYVQLRPNVPDSKSKKPPGKIGPYKVKFEPGNSKVKDLRPGHTGNCFRVRGGISTPEQGILIHEAPNVSWVIGCIGPRPLLNFEPNMKNLPGNPSYVSMQELFQFVGTAEADFFVLDW
ncbi:MAG TPA: hypothetical protein VGH38_08095 [Bryobacteraceae bacterium]